MTSALASSPDFIVRPATDDDLNYVRKTWHYVHLRWSKWAGAVGGAEVYLREHPPLRERAIERGAVTIACRESVPSGICGFAVTEEALLHFVYVKPPWRKLGVAKLLLRPMLDRTDVQYTHRADMCDCGAGHSEPYDHHGVRCPNQRPITSLLPVPKGWGFNPYPFMRST